MPERKLEFSSAARQDLKKIAAYISGRSGHREIGRRVARELTQACERMAKAQILFGRLRPDLGVDLRSVSVSNYLIIFKYAPDALYVIAIVHGARDIPALMKSRPE
jgi:toxin ParE1/3/4